jgi:two-component sensor histidine kinase
MSENRIHSMSLVHEHLYQSENLSAVDIGAYLEAISADLRQVYQGEMPIEIRTASDRIYLDIYQAIPLGLILNELISNALEHAFLPRESGSLWVSLSYHPGRAGWCDLRVKDNGGGSTAEGWDTEDVSGGASEAAETRLGLELVRILSEQLGGSLTLVREEGTEFLLTFPAECGHAESGQQCRED